MSAAEPRANLATPVTKLQELYDRHLYLDAFTLTEDLWKSSTNIQRLSIDELILAARLASRLGGVRLSRWLLRMARRRDPVNPQVRYFSRHVQPSRFRLLDELGAFNAQPDLGGDDPEARAAWYASFALTWATLRDFERAHECISLAHSLVTNDSWVQTCEASVLGMADRWSDALCAAERAWEVDPGSPFAANSLGASLLHLGRVQEAADRLYGCANTSQSYQIVAEACWFQCAIAETLDERQRHDCLERARSLAAKLPRLAPLADRETRTNFARMQLDIAELADDHAEIEHWSAELRSPFHRQLLANLKKNTSGKRIRLPFHRTIQTYQACVPASIAAALSAGGVHILAEEIAAEVTFGGTYEWAAADWLRERGFHVRFFAVTAEVAARLIHHQIAFVISWDADSIGHAVATVGLDERAETLLIHDPQSFRSMECLFTAFNRNASPLGIKGMAVVAQHRASELESVLPPESALMEAAQEHQKITTLQGPAAGRQIVSDAAKRFPSHLGVLYLQSIQHLYDGCAGQALRGFQELLRPFPNSPLVRLGYIAACRALGNSALIHQVLKDIVERGMLPGLDSQQIRIHAPERYVCEYADLLRLSAATRDEAELLLYSLIRRQSNSAGAWHNLGDLLWQKRHKPRALLCFRVASCLELSDDHYAAAYADALADQKREEDGLRWLEERARRLGRSQHAVAPWISWLVALEHRGYPERAIAACNEVLAFHTDSPELLSFAVRFLARMGDWQAAERNLSRLHSGHKPAAYFEASVHFFCMRGDLKSATLNAASWIDELPRSMAARYAMLDLIALQEGPRSAVETAATWLRENRNNEEFEQAFCAQLDRLGDSRWKKYSVLLRRLKRNREDAWAWREATFCALYEYERTEARQQQRLDRRISQLLAECDRTSNEHVATIRAHALWSECRGDWSAAIAKSLEAIELDPQGFYSYRRIWECSARLEPLERTQLWTKIEPILLNSPGHLSLAREVMGLLAERFGILEAQNTIESWMAIRPGDPNVLEAAADLLIDRGHGRSDALRAIAMLKPAVERYPYHSGLRFSLANGYRRAGEDPDAHAVLSEIVRRHPDNASALIQLAWIGHRRGDHQYASRMLDSAAATSPRNPDVLEARVQMLIDNRLFDDASQAIEHGLQSMPENVHWRSRAISLLSQCGAAAKAVQVARAGIEIYPRGAYLWLLLGRTLNDMRQFAGLGEIEFCLHQSLRFNSGLFESADLLSMLLTEQRRYDDAAAVMREIERTLPDPSPALGRLAWIKRVQGARREALDELSQVVTDRPWYSWAWNLLTTWLEEDADWEKTRQLLRDIPAQMLTNISFRLQRLLLLEKAGTDRAELDTEWDSLLRDFPENVSLFVKRYDSLHESERFDAAASVLDSILRFDSDNPFILARQVEVLSRAADKGPALEVALRVCFAPFEESPWPADKIWEVALGTGFRDQLYARAVQRLANRERPTRRTFARMIAYPMRLETKRGLQPRTKTWIVSGGARELTRLHLLLQNAPWESSSLRAELYRELCEYGYQRVVKRVSKKNASPMSTDEWSQVGRAVIGAHSYSEGRRLLGTWRNRPGVGMWMVSNYTLCLSRFRRSHLEELRTTCRDALSALPHDHCANYLAHVLAEACALLGDKQGFLEVWSAHATYFGTELKKHEYFQPRRRYLLADIPLMARYLQQNEAWPYRKMLWKLRWNSLPSLHITGGSRQSLARMPWWIFWVLYLLVRLLFKNSH
jgi:tetratricopeptide (TPR) repeat protein